MKASKAMKVLKIINIILLFFMFVIFCGIGMPQSCEYQANKEYKKSNVVIVVTKKSVSETKPSFSNDFADYIVSLDLDITNNTTKKMSSVFGNIEVCDKKGNKLVTIMLNCNNIEVEKKESQKITIKVGGEKSDANFMSLCNEDLGNLIFNVIPEEAVFDGHKKALTD